MNDQGEGERDKRSGIAVHIPASKFPATREEREKAYAKHRAQGRSIVDAALEKRRKAVAICLDATGSMGNLIADAKKSIGAIVDGVMKHGAVSVELQIFAYRDYVDGPLVLQASPLSSNPSELVRWLDVISAHGGGANDGEAIDAALKAVAEGSYAVALVAGDEPPLSRGSLNDYGVTDTAFDWARRLGAKGVPVHTFVVGADSRTVRDFKELAFLSGGQTGRLDGSKEMIDMAVMAILSQLRGNEAVLGYAKVHQLSHHAREFKHLLLSGPTKTP